MNDEKVQPTPLYQSILAKGKDALKIVSDIVTQRKDKRAFKSAYDNALEKRDKAIQEKQKLYEKVGEYSENLPKIVKAAFEEREQTLAMEIIQAEYKVLFGTEMKVDSED